MQSEVVEVLLVEDNPGDARLAQKALEQSKFRTRVSLVQDGAQALEYLRQEGRFAGSPRPGLILLDLGLPGKDGREVLAAMLADERLKHIPVVVMTGSRSEEAMAKTYELPASCFIAKPSGLQQFMTVVRLLDTFWFSISKH